MQAILFYLAYPFIYLIASLPFWLLYRLSDFLYHVLWLSGYRRGVVLQNLRNSFPEKDQHELDHICKAYYRYLCDLILETLKTLTMTEKESRERTVLHHEPWMDKLHAEKRSFILMMGHYGNWEWAGPCFTLNTKFQLVVVYRPLSNPYFEKMMVRMRTKFGTRITPVNNTLRDMVANRGQITATTFIADQAAPAVNAYWTKFLNQDTAAFTGAEKLAVKFNYPVVFLNVVRPKRGYYELFFELMVPEPGLTAENEITEIFNKRLEKEIRKDPTTWLWSHKRWKHKRPVDFN